MRAIFFNIIGFVVIAAGIATAQLRNDVRILSETPSSIVLEITPQVTSHLVKGTQGEAFTLFSALNASSEIDSVVDAVLPVRKVPLLLPGSRYSLHVLSAEHKTVSGIELVPAPRLQPDKEFGATFVFQTPVRQHTSNPAYHLVQLDTYPDGKNSLGVLSVRPVRCDAAKKSAEICTMLIVRIDHDSWGDSQNRTSTLLAGNRPFVESGQRAQLAKVAANSPLASGPWFRMEIVETGMYALDASFFQQAGISLSSLGSIQSIRIFGGNGEQLQEDLNVPRPDGPVEIPRLVIDRNNNGLFDSGDLVLFYAKGPRGWKYNPVQKLFYHYIHPYTEKNYYFLTYGGASGRGMDSVAFLSVAVPFRPTDFLDKQFVEQERYNLIGSGRQWVGQAFDIVDSTGVYAVSIPGLVPGTPIRYRFDLLTRSSSVDMFSVFDNNQPVAPPIYMGTVDVSSGDNIGVYAYDTGPLLYSATPTIANEQSIVKFRFSTSNTVAKGWLDWFEVQYRRGFKAVGDQLLFTSPDTSAVVEYSVTGLSPEEAYIFDVTRYDSVERITNVTTPVGNGSTRIFQLPQSSGGVRELIAVGMKGFKFPAIVQKVANQNIHGMSGPVDFIIITPQAFHDQAERLKVYRQQHDSLQTIVVDVEQIYNEFSSGQQDPMAIRDFLRYAMTHWAVRRQYVLLLGEGHFDYKNITTSTPNWIPPYETVESNFQIISYASDDYFVFLNPADQTHVSMALGRLPARSVQEAQTMIDKIINYGSSSPFDPWRNRITFVADDGLTSTGDDGNTHTAQAEILAQTYTPSRFDRQKIYIVEYPTVLGASGRRKPTANVAIIDAINRGTVMMNYTGHGNEHLLAHEAIFTREESLPLLVNKNRLTFFVGATCNFGQYDNPNDQSAGELFIAMDQGGAIGEVTASRAVYSPDNADLNYLFYSNLFNGYPANPVARLGDAMLLTKTTRNEVNDMKYHLLADPTLRLNVPWSNASIDSVDGKPTAILSTMKSLGRSVVKGEVRRQDGSMWSDFSGRGELELFDSKRIVTVPEWNWSFEVNGSVLYRGAVSVTRGAFSASFPIPKDVSYGNRSRISFYAADTLKNTDVLGYTENVVISGTDSLAAIDTTGPQVDVFLDDYAFRSGDVVQPNATLLVNLYDDNGINTSTSGVGHRLEAVLKNPAKTIDLTDYYRGDLDTYKSGKIVYPLTQIPEGSNEITVRAWDTYNNSSERDLRFEVKSDAGFGLFDVMNFPNPFSSSTVFTFQRASTDPVNVELKIYTVAGRLIEEKQFSGVTDRFVQIPWNGTDREGSEVANGVYFFKIKMESGDGKNATEAIGKAAVMR